MLVCEDLKFVLTEERPPVPPVNAACNVRETHQNWVKANEKTSCYLLAGMSDVLAKKHETMATASEMMLSLQGIFGQPSK